MEVVAIEERHLHRGASERASGPQPAEPRAQNQDLRTWLAHALVSLACIALSSGCAASSARPTAATPSGASEVGWTETGVASWYGDPFHGRHTASGEVYDMDGPTAAHRTLPFGTRLRVENLDNGRSVELTVNDRGPFARGRILDVSRWGARQLDMIGPGTARVRITVLEPGSDLLGRRGGCVVVQVAAHRDRPSAERRRAELANRGHPAMIEQAGEWYRVVAGPYRREDEARDALRSLGGFLRRCDM